MLFWILFAYSILPAPKFRNRIVTGVVLGTCMLEVLQLWKPAPLVAFRSTKFGAALIGASFAWNDFPPYVLGGIAGWLMLWLLPKLCLSSDPD